MHQKRTSLNSNPSIDRQIDFLSLQSINFQPKFKTTETEEATLSNLISSRQILFESPKLLNNSSDQQSSQKNSNPELDMSILVLEGLQIARRNTQRDEQINIIVPEFKGNLETLKQQYEIMMRDVDLLILFSQREQIQQKIKVVKTEIQKMRDEINPSKPANKIYINPRRYFSPKNYYTQVKVITKPEDIKAQELSLKIKKKKQEYIRNKTKIEQLTWQFEKMQRKQKLQLSQRNREQVVRTISKKKLSKNQKPERMSFGKFQLKDNGLRKTNSKRKINTLTPKGLSALKRPNLKNSGDIIDKSEIKAGDSIFTHEEAKKHFLFRRLKIVKQSISLHQATYSKIIAQLQLECQVFSKELQCIEDELTANIYTLEGSSLSNKMFSYGQINRQKHSKSISPPPSNISKGNSQNLRNLARKNQTRKLSSYIGNKNRESSLTCKKVRTKSAHEEEVQAKKKHLTGENRKTEISPQVNPIKQSQIIEEYFQNTSKSHRKINDSVKPKYTFRIPKNY